MSITVIINPIAGGASAGEARDRAQLASAVLASRGEDAEVLVTQRRGQARELAEAAVRRGARIVLAWGGDGTVNEVASALMLKEIPLGIVPSGSGNGLARALGIPTRPDRAIAHALASRPRDIDAGELGSRTFFNVAGIGLDAHVAACFDRDDGGRRGLGTYLRIAARELLTYRPRNYRINRNGDHLAVPALLIALANSPQFGNGARICAGRSSRRWTPGCGGCRRAIARGHALRRAASLHGRHRTRSRHLDPASRARRRRVRQSDDVSRGRRAGAGRHATRGAGIAWRAPRVRQLKGRTLSDPEVRPKPRTRGFGTGGSAPVRVYRQTTACFRAAQPTRREQRAPPGWPSPRLQAKRACRRSHRR